MQTHLKPIAGYLIILFTMHYLNAAASDEVPSFAAFLKSIFSAGSCFQQGDLSGDEDADTSETQEVSNQHEISPETEIGIARVYCIAKELQALVHTEVERECQKRLGEAIIAENLQEITALLALNVDVNFETSISPYFGSPLQIATRLRSLEIIELLLARNAKVDFRSSEGTCLHTALEGPITPKTVEVIDRLIAAGAPVNAIDFYNKTPLHRAVALQPKQLGLEESYSEMTDRFNEHNKWVLLIMTSLIKAGANRKKRDIMKQTPGRFLENHFMTLDQRFLYLWRQACQSRIELLNAYPLTDADVSDPDTEEHKGSRLGSSLIERMTLL